MIDTEHLTYEVVGTTAIVTMNRPEAKNALSVAMLVGLVDAWAEIESNDEIRCAILTGAGGTFCSGMDLKSMSSPESEKYRERREAGQRHWNRVVVHQIHAIRIALRGERKSRAARRRTARSRRC